MRISDWSSDVCSSDLLRRGLAPRAAAPDDPILASTLWGLSFGNPLGLAAGFDKDAQVMAAMLGLGFGFVEVGSVTPRPHPGNPRQRIFRLAEDGAVITQIGRATCRERGWTYV